MKKFIKENSRSLVFFTLFILSLIGQVFTGYSEYLNKSGHFAQATFVNWESEFYMMKPVIKL